MELCDECWTITLHGLCACGTSMKTSRLPSARCPHCHSHMDAATSVDANATPTSGDITVYGRCKKILRFGDALALVRTSRSELDVALDADQLRQVLALSAMLKAQA